MDENYGLFAELVPEATSHLEQFYREHCGGTMPVNPNQDKPMNSYERYMNMIEGRQVDTAPRLPILMAFAANFMGSDYAGFASDYHVLADAIVLSGCRICDSLTDEKENN